MKNSSVMLSVLAGIVIAALSLAGCTSGKANGEVGSGEAVKTNGTGTKIVYINTDTLMSNYLLAIELNEAFGRSRRNAAQN